MAASLYKNGKLSISTYSFIDLCFWKRSIESRESPLAAWNATFCLWPAGTATLPKECDLTRTESATRRWVSLVMVHLPGFDSAGKNEITL